MEDRRDRLRALGELLRRLRREAKLTGKDLAQRAQVAQPTISRIETGQLLPTPETVERLAAALNLDEAARTELDDLLVRLRDEVSRLKGGLAGRESANAAKLRAASKLTCFQAAMIPPLLQTAEYARHALAIGRDVDEADTAKATAVRIEAQTALYEPGRRFSFLLTEGAVRTWPGSPALMSAQLDRLAQLSTLTHMSLGLIPWQSATTRFPLHGFTIYDDTTSVVETFTGDLTLTDPEDIATHTAAFDAFATQALYGDDLRQALTQIASDFHKLDPHSKK
ncbi:helix-turn-helix transcriptional regulator [Nonomuraea sp. NBC_01738]|uniref:helix-turn-helix domain-containing protein n=1 Tax=Nonomuraea sp. NBC_01738 TaxID=2976003 RepID=UPI002E142668|nr:helix-turn-helix transcriptional regulator [Nonomuraea sp. NBC_01738]